MLTAKDVRDATDYVNAAGSDYWAVVAERLNEKLRADEKPELGSGALRPFETFTVIALHSDVDTTQQFVVTVVSERGSFSSAKRAFIEQAIRAALSLSSPIEPPADLDFEFAQRLQVILDRRKLTAVVPETVQFYVLSDKFVSEVVQELGPWLRALTPSRQGAAKRVEG